MKFVVDARMMGAKNTRGIGRYIEEIIRRAPDFLNSEDEVSLIVSDPSFSLRSSIFDLRVVNIRWYSLSEQLRLPGIFRRAAADIVWVPHWNVPLLYRGPFAITLHDLLLLHQPQSAKASTLHPLVSWIKRLGFNLILRSAICRASVIFTPTRSVADDVAKRFPLAKDRIVVTGEGIDHLPEPSSLVASGPVVSQFSLGYKATKPQGYLMYVGSAYPHKRLDLLLEVWRRLSSAHPELRLLIVGERDIFMQRYEARAKDLPRVEFKGRVSDDELTSLLAGATAFVFPSSFEGFGLPPLEALAVGTPVVCADIPSLREILPFERKDGVFFFKNGDADDMIGQVEIMLSCGFDAKRAARLSGEKLRERWTWKRSAEITLSALKHAANKNHCQEDKEKDASAGVEALE